MKLTTRFTPVAALDPDGHGWEKFDVPFEQVTGVIVQGSNPASDGYWQPVTAEAQGRTENGVSFTVVDLYGKPGQPCGVYVKSLDPQ